LGYLQILLKEIYHIYSLYASARIASSKIYMTQIKDLSVKILEEDFYDNFSNCRKKLRFSMTNETDEKNKVFSSHKSQRDLSLQTLKAFVKSNNEPER
jgi:hypothetical protein